MEEELKKDETIEGHDSMDDFVPPASSTGIEEKQDGNKSYEEPLPEMPQTEEQPIPIENLEKIISETLELIGKQQNHTASQKNAMSTMAFMLNCIQNDLRAYEDHVEKLNTFLINNDVVQRDWYLSCAQQLLSYPNYVDCLKDSREKIIVKEVPCPISESILRNLAYDLSKCLYAAGIHAKTQIVMDKSIRANMDKRRVLCKAQKTWFGTWFELLNMQIENKDKTSNMLFEIAANIDFLKTGVTNEPLKLVLGPN